MQLLCARLLLGVWCYSVPARAQRVLGDRSVLVRFEQNAESVRGARIGPHVVRYSTSLRRFSYRER